MIKNLPALQESQERRVRSLVRKILWSRAWHSTSVFLPGESHGQGVHKELDTTEVTDQAHSL